MRKYKEETRIEKILESCSCDKCGADIEKWGECFVLEARFGYHSRLFGDMSEMKADLCEKCLFDFVKTFKNDVHQSTDYIRD